MVTFHGALLEGDRVDLVSAPGRMWLVVDGDVRVSARFSPA
jgi:hypothetical protein